MPYVVPEYSQLRQVELECVPAQCELWELFGLYLYCFSLPGLVAFYLMCVWFTNSATAWRETYVDF